MGISFSNLVEKSRTLSIAMADGNLKITYDPSKLSAAYIQKMQENSEENDPLAMAKMFCHVVTSWDLVGPLHEEGHSEFIADGDAVPVDPRFVAWIPGPVLTHVIEKIGEDSSPKSQRSNSR